MFYEEFNMKNINGLAENRQIILFMGVDAFEKIINDSLENDYHSVNDKALLRDLKLIYKIF